MQQHPLVVHVWSLPSATRSISKSKRSFILCSVLQFVKEKNPEIRRGILVEAKVWQFLFKPPPTTHLVGDYTNLCSLLFLCILDALLGHLKGIMLILLVDRHLEVRVIRHGIRHGMVLRCHRLGGFLFRFQFRFQFLFRFLGLFLLGLGRFWCGLCKLGKDKTKIEGFHKGFFCFTIYI